jgi:glutathione synthase/RimK-type ligase-like ATP-grasp enzyme
MRPTFWFATSTDHPDLTNDDRLAVDCIQALGGRVEPLLWGDLPRSAGDGDRVVVRSCWDYHLAPARFLAWLHAVDAAGFALANGLAALEWNMHKRYLLELEREHGIAIPGTILVEQGARTTLGEAMQCLGTSRVVLKPAISLSSHDTHRFDACTDAAEAEFSRQVARQDVLVQQFLPQIGGGELSLVFFGQRFSHAVTKVPPAGEFRVQQQFGGRVRACMPPASVIATAERILHATGDELDYARVDGVLVDGQFVLMELELIDPVLFLSHDAAAPARFARALGVREGQPA